jgi:hypothetical protein
MSPLVPDPMRHQDQTETNGSSGLGNLGLLVALPLAGLFYGVVAWQHPIVGRSLFAVLFLTLVFITSALLIFARHSGDALHPLRLVGAIFLFSYCISPLLRVEIDWFFMSSVESLLARSASFVLFALLFLVLGYSIPVVRPVTRRLPPDRIQTDQPIIRYYALCLFAVGMLAYFLLVIQAGGIKGMIASDQNRVEFAKGAGRLLFASYFMFSGGALYFASRTAVRRRMPWVYAWPLALAFVLFLLLQNRSRSIHCLVIVLVIWHYQVRPLRIARLVPFGAVMAVFMLFVGYARSPRIRPFLLTDPLYVVRDAWYNIGDLAEEFFGASLNRLQQVMLAFDSWPERASYEWGSSLLSALNPLLRLVGLVGLQFDALGNQFFRLAHPEVVLDVQTGYHPSLLGEALANFPWLVAIFAVSAFGFVLRFLYISLVVNRRGFVMLAAYSAIIFRVVDMIIVGVGQLIFQIFVVLIPVLLALPLAALGQSAPPRARGLGKGGIGSEGVRHPHLDAADSHPDRTSQ